MASNSGNSARAQLIKTRRGTWIDESLLPAARRECLGVLREAARKAVGEATYLPGWISDATDSVMWDLTDLSEERLGLKPTPAEEEMKDEVYFRSAPGRIRTSDSRFRKPLLYPLSYRRIRLRYAGFSSPQTPVSAVRKQ